MRKIRCAECGRTLLLMEYGKVEIKCPRCGRIMNIEYDRDNEQRGRQAAAESTGPLAHIKGR